MSKLLALFLLLSCSVAQAEWTFVAENEWNSYYFDYTRAQRVSKSIVRVWTLSNAKQLSKGQDYMSHLAYKEFDCDQRANRGLSAVFYSGAMASGTMMGSVSTPTQWQFAVPMSATEGMLEAACAIK